LDLILSIANLSVKNADAIRHNKDKQEGAIYVFTIVTVIFLPISTVASVLGMNTNDIRNMEKTQWVFWAAAVPLTAVIIVVSLFAAGIFVWPREWRKGGDEKALSKDDSVGFSRRRKTRTRRRRQGHRSGSSGGDSSDLEGD
jgi:hypothetical protein